MDRETRRVLMQRLTRDADRICARFGLRYRSLECERGNVTSRYGICYDDGSIKIRLWHVTTREPLKYSSLVNTLCHELAHLRHFNHGPRFQRFYAQILAWARAEGIYRPRKGAAPNPRPDTFDLASRSGGATGPPHRPIPRGASPPPAPAVSAASAATPTPASPPPGRSRRPAPPQGPLQLELF